MQTATPTIIINYPSFNIFQNNILKNPRTNTSTNQHKIIGKTDLKILKTILYVAAASMTTIGLYGATTITLSSKMIIVITPEIVIRCRILGAICSCVASVLGTWSDESSKKLGNFHLYMKKQCCDLGKYIGSMASCLAEKTISFVRYYSQSIRD